MCTVCTLCTLHNKQIRLDLLKTLLQYYGKSLEALPGVAYPGFRDNRSTLNTKTGYKKRSHVFFSCRDHYHIKY